MSEIITQKYSIDEMNLADTIDTRYANGEFGDPVIADVAFRKPQAGFKFLCVANSTANAEIDSGRMEFGIPRLRPDFPETDEFIQIEWVFVSAGPDKQLFGEVTIAFYRG